MIATANAIMYCGAVPVFAEVNEHYNLDIIDVEKRITSKTKAILLVHQIGMPADIEAFQILCNKYNLKLIEDAACAIGSMYKGKKIGSHSELVCFSFHPRKIITTGDGGMITTSNIEYYERLKKLRQHSMSINDRVRHESKSILIEEYPEVGYNYRMTDIQAAVGIKQLEKVDWIIQERRKIADKYINGLKDLNHIRLPYESEGYFTNWQSFSMYILKNSPITRNDLMQKLLDKGVSTRRGIMLSHREKTYMNTSQNILPISEDLSDNSLILPLFVPMKEEEITYIIDSIKLLFK